jgi:glycine/D-amino acid oxidase-like deaminating enzyme
MNEPVRIAVVGAGNVGATFAYSVVLSGLASEIVLLDADKARAEGQAMDLDHAVPFNQPVRVWAGTLRRLQGRARHHGFRGRQPAPGRKPAWICSNATSPSFAR